VRRLADLTYLRARSVVMVAVAVMVLAAPLAFTVFDRVEPFDIADPDSEVERAYAAFEESSGRGWEPEVVLLVEPAAGAASAVGSAEVQAVAERLATVDGIAAVETPADDDELVSTDRLAALVIGRIAAGAERPEVGDAVDEAFSDDPKVRAGGISVAAHQISVQTEEDTRRIELFAAALLLLLLLGLFRSPLAAARPLLLAGFSIGVTLALLSLISGAVDVDL